MKLNGLREAWGTFGDSKGLAEMAAAKIGKQKTYWKARTNNAEEPRFAAGAPKEDLIQRAGFPLGAKPIENVACAAD